LIETAHNNSTASPKRRSTFKLTVIQACNKQFLLLHQRIHHHTLFPMCRYDTLQHVLHVNCRSQPISLLISVNNKFNYAQIGRVGGGYAVHSYYNSLMLVAIESPFAVPITVYTNLHHHSPFSSYPAIYWSD